MAMDAGIELDTGIDMMWNKFKTRSSKDFDAVFLGINDSKKVVVQKQIERDTSLSAQECYEKILANLPNEDACYIGCKVRNDSANEALAVIKWCPDSIAVGKRMIYALAWKKLKEAFTGANHIEASDLDQLLYKEILPKLIKEI